MTARTAPTIPMIAPIESPPSSLAPSSMVSCCSTGWPATGWLVSPASSDGAGVGVPSSADVPVGHSGQRARRRRRHYMVLRRWKKRPPRKKTLRKIPAFSPYLAPVVLRVTRVGTQTKDALKNLILQSIKWGGKQKKQYAGRIVTPRTKGAQRDFGESVDNRLDAWIGKYWKANIAACNSRENEEDVNGREWWEMSIPANRRTVYSQVLLVQPNPQTWRWSRRRSQQRRWRVRASSCGIYSEKRRGSLAA